MRVGVILRDFNAGHYVTRSAEVDELLPWS